MLNLAGSEFDFAAVVYAVIAECEHRRRGCDLDTFEHQVGAAARTKLAQIKGAYDEMGGSEVYWRALEKEVLETTLPQYVDAAREITEGEERGFSVWRKGDVTARLVFALCGLVLGGIIIAVPFIPIFENMFAFALTFGGFFYPDLVRYTYERRYMKLLNHLVDESARYQESAHLRYMTSAEFDKALEEPPSPPRLPQ